MQIQKNFSLKHLNTFGIAASARYFAEITSLADFKEIIVQPQFKNLPKFILGGGSNILFTRDFDGIVLKNNIKGRDVVKEDTEFVYLKTGAGEIWHETVEYCLQKNWGGIENLSLIPGCVGAAPIQNIGAYGMELKEVFYELEATRIETGELVTFTKEDCQFGYRDSIFKNKDKDKFIIANVTLRLCKKPVFNTNYGAIQEELQKMGVKELSIQAISEAVCRIRRSKLPDPAVIGNAGSFFKNPVVSKDKFDELKNNFANIVGYPSGNGSVKLAAGWLIEQCGWKGKRTNDAGVHQNQALVLVNYGKANGKEIFDLAMDVKKSVKQKFGVDLETEVNII